MAIIKTQEVAKIGDSFYLPGRYEVPDQALLYDRKVALVDFMASSLVEHGPSGSHITGLMQIELADTVLKRHDTVVLVEGFRSSVDILGRVVFDDVVEPLYTLVSVSEWKTDTLTPKLIFKSTHEITPPVGWMTHLYEGVCTVTLNSGLNNVPIIIDGEQVDTVIVDVKTLEVGVEGVSKDKMYVYPTMNGQFVKGLKLTAPDCTFKENSVSYTMTFVGEPEAVNPRTIVIEDPRPWPTTNVEFSFPVIASFTLNGLPETTPANSTIELTLTADPDDAIGIPVWSVEGTGATLASDNRKATLTLKSAKDTVKVKISWGGITRDWTTSVELESLSIAKDTTAGLQDLYVKSSGTNENPMWIKVVPDANLPASATSPTRGVTVKNIKYNSDSQYRITIVVDSTTPIGTNAVSVDVDIGGFKETLKYTTVKRAD